jgi:hypothetical protein
MHTLKKLIKIKFYKNKKGMALALRDGIINLSKQITIKRVYLLIKKQTVLVIKKEKKT